MDLKDILKRPIITEKSIQATALGKFAFEVDRRANKIQIAQAVKKFFKVTPIKVKTINVKGRSKWTRGSRKKIKTRSWKKAMLHPV